MAKKTNGMPTKQGQGPSMPNINFETVYETRAFQSQTANGTGRAMGTGWNRLDQKYGSPEAEAGGAWKGGPSNRTAE